MNETYATSQMVNVEFSQPDAATATTNAVNQALAFCAQKMHLHDTTLVPQLLRQGDPTARGYFEYSVARALAEHISALDDQVQAIYLYTPDATPEDIIFGDAKPTLIHLIVQARRKTSALASLLEVLDRSLAQCYAEMMNAPAQAHLLDVQVVDDAEAAARSGVGAMLAWCYNQPLSIWKR